MRDLTVERIEPGEQLSRVPVSAAARCYEVTRKRGVASLGAAPVTYDLDPGQQEDGYQELIHFLFLKMMPSLRFDR